MASGVLDKYRITNKSNNDLFLERYKEKKRSIIKVGANTTSLNYNRKNEENENNKEEINNFETINNEEFLPPITDKKGNVVDNDTANLVDILKIPVDLLTNAGYGIVKGLEGVVDAGASLVGTIGGIFDKDFKEDVGEFVKQDYTKDLLGGVKEMANSKALDNEVGDFINGAFESVGQMLPSIGVGLITGGAGSMALFGASAGGSASEQALNEGASLEKATGYGILSGVSEALIESISGGIGGLGKSALQKTGSKLARNSLANFASNVIGEGVEEMVGEIIDPYLKRMTYDKNAELSSPEEILKAGALGSFTSLIMMGGQSALTPKGVKVANEIQEDVDSIEVIENDKTLSKEEKQAQIKEISDRIEEKSNQFEEELRKSNIDSDYFKTEISDKKINDIKAKIENDSEKGKDVTNLRNSYNDYIDMRDNQIKNMSEEKRANYLKGKNLTYKYDSKSGEISESYSKLNDAQRANLDKSVNIINNASSRSNKRLSVIVDYDSNYTNVGNNGFIDTKNNNIVINPYNMDANEVSKNIATHELGHFIETSSKGKALQEKAINELKATNEYQTQFDKSMKKYSRIDSFNKLSEEEKTTYINQELANDYMASNMFSSQEAVNNIVNEDKSFGRKILDWLKSFKNTPLENKIKKMENMFSKALENVRNSNLDTRYSLNGKGNGYNGKSMSNNAVRAYSDGKMPLSKWTKEIIINEILDINSNLDETLLNKLTLTELRHNYLEYDSWHHTGYLYNKTNFYDISNEAIENLTNEDINELIEKRVPKKVNRLSNEEKAMKSKKELISKFQRLSRKYNLNEYFINKQFVDEKLDSNIIENGIKAIEEGINAYESEKVHKYKTINRFLKNYLEEYYKNKDIRYSLNEDNTIDKLGEKVKTNNLSKEKSLKEKLSDYKNKLEFNLTNSQANVERALQSNGVDKGKSKAYTDRARSRTSVSSNALENGIYSPITHKQLTTKSFNELFVESNPFNIDSQTNEYYNYKKIQNTYALLNHNIDRMNLKNTIIKSNVKSIGLSVESENAILKYMEDNNTKKINFEEIKTIVTNENDLEIIENSFQENKPIFGKYIVFDNLSNEAKEDIKINNKDLYNSLVENRMLSESEVKEFENGKIFNKYFSDDISNEESVKLIKELDKTHPELNKWFKDVKNLSNALVDLRFDYGMITKEERTILKELYPNYVPTFRDMDNPITKVTNGNGTKGSDNGLKKAKGSDLVIAPIDVSFAKQIQGIYSQGELNLLKNRLANSFLNSTIKNNDYMAISEDKPIYNTKLEDIDYTNEDNLPNEKVGETHTKISYYDKGEKKTILVKNELFDSLEELAPKQTPFEAITKPITKWNSAFKNLVTTFNPFFTVRNVARDIQDAVINSEFGGKIISNLPNAYKEITSNGKYYQEAKANGLEYGSFFDYDFGTKENKPNPKMNSWYNKTLGRGVRFVSEKVEKLNKLTEQATRLSEYILAREKGYSIEEAIYKAHEVTVNFGRSGKLVKIVNRTLIPFLNAQVQGFFKFYNTVISKKTLAQWGMLLSKVALFGMLPSLINRLLYNDDEEYDELGQYYKDNFYLIKVGKSFIKIPKGRVLTMFTSASDRTTDYVMNDNKDAFKGLDDTWLQAMSPVNDFRTIFSPIIKDLPTNTTWYGGSIENSNDSKVRPSERYDVNTSSISITLGKLFNYSPKKINYLLDQYTGIVGDIIIPATSKNSTTNALSFITSNVSVDPVFKSKYAATFNDKYTNLTYSKNSDNDAISILQLKYMNKVKSKIALLYDKEREIQNDTTLSSKEKEEQIRLNRILINNAYKYAVNNLDALGTNLSTKTLSIESMEDDYATSLYQTFGSDATLSLILNDEKYNMIKELNVDTDIYFKTYLDTKGNGRKYAFEYIEEFYKSLSKKDKENLFISLGYKLK